MLTEVTLGGANDGSKTSLYIHSSVCRCSGR